MKWSAIFLVVSVATFWLVVTSVTSHEPDTSKSPANLVPSARARFVLPKLFDFSRFKSVFHKHYTSFIEELRRQKIFMANSVKAYISSILYKRGDSSTYKSVNDMSDLTPEDIERSKISADQLRIDTNEKVYFENESPAGEMPKKERNKRSLFAKDSAKEAKTSRWDLGSHKDKSANAKQANRRGNDRESGGKITASNVVGSILGSANRLLFNSRGTNATNEKRPNSKAAAETRQQVDPSQLADEVFSDLRETKCFFAPRSQGQCGCCYAFAAVALYEFLHCRSTGQLKAFSEQYVLDCGQRMGLHGCGGGNLRNVAVFMDKYGMELRNSYPYRKKQDQCPYEARATPAEMGHIKPEKVTSGSLEIADFDQFLRRKPILFGLKLSPEFRSYGGGVDDNEGCQSDDSHAMLIVGHGREDGKEYYLFRNSHSYKWGEAGHYKLNKKSLLRCAVNPLGVISLAKFGQQKGEAKNGAPKSEIKQRYRDYLLMQNSENSNQ